MTNLFELGATGPVGDMIQRQREQSDLIKRALGPSFAVQELTRRIPPGIAALQAAESGILKSAMLMKTTRIGEVLAAGEALRLGRTFALTAFASPSWMVALQRTGLAINRDPAGFLATQRGLVGATVPEMIRIGRLFESHKSVIGKLMAAPSIGAQFKAMSAALSPQLGVLKITAERARMVDMMTLHATAQVVATSSAVIIAEHVIEAQRIIDAIGQAEDPAQSTDLVVAFMTLMSAMFSMFRENTLQELRGIGAIALISILLNFYTIYKEITPQDLSPAEQLAHAKMVVHAETIEEKLEEILAADEAAKSAYLDTYPRGKLMRAAPIRREPQGKAQILMRGDASMEIAVKESREKWRLVIYRDPLSDQLSEGWVYAPAIKLYAAPAG